MKEKVFAINHRGAIVILAAACFLASTALIARGAFSRVPDSFEQAAGQTAQQLASKDKESSPTRRRDVSTAPANSAIGREIMWKAPGDIASRDLFHGIG